MRVQALPCSHPTSNPLEAPLSRSVFPAARSMPRSLARLSMRLFWKRVPLSGSVLSGMPCQHKPRFSRPLLAVARGAGRVSIRPVVASTILSTWTLPWCDLIHQASLYLHFSHRPSYLRGFNHLSCLKAAHFTCVENLCNNIHGQVHPSIPSPSVCCISSLKV